MQIEIKKNKNVLIQAVKEQLTCNLDGESVLLNLKTGVYLSLNEMATVVWSKLQSPITAGALCDAIVAEYEVETPQCESDLEAVMNQLLQQGLIEIKSTGS